MIYKSSINKGFKKLIKFRLGCLINMILNVVVPPTPQCKIQILLKPFKT